MSNPDELAAMRLVHLANAEREDRSCTCSPEDNPPKPCQKKYAYTECLKARIAELEEALAFYADPGTYFAIMCIGDPPCGDFIRDFSDDHDDPELTGPRYGARARAALRGKS